eukprot:1828878-Ditylum_brightwellii.AAC.1
MVVNDINGHGRFFGQLELQGINDIGCFKSSYKIGFVFFSCWGTGFLSTEVGTNKFVSREDVGRLSTKEDDVEVPAD